MFVAICWLYTLFSRHAWNLKFWCLQELYLVIWDVTKLDGNEYFNKIVICSKCLSCVSNECCKCQWAQRTACCILMFWNSLFVLYLISRTSMQVLFSSTENGRSSFVRQLEPDWHIDTNPEIVTQLAVCYYISWLQSASQIHALNSIKLLITISLFLSND